MPSSDLLTQIATWYDVTIANSPIWAAIGFAAITSLALIGLVFLVKAIRRLLQKISNMVASRRRKSQQGYGIGVARLNGPSGKVQTKNLIKALETHFAKFSFGAPFEIIKAPALRAKGSFGLRASAVKWLETSATDLIIWGGRESRRSESFDVEVLSLEGSLAPREAIHSQGKLPVITDENADTTGPVCAYLIARALQPGLGTASAFKAEKLVPVADILFASLEDKDALPARTKLTIETDYCAMGLHIGGQAHLLRVAELRRKRLSGSDALAYEVEVPARIDLGRALLGLSNIKFDPVRVREAMDHLKVAIDLLRTDHSLQLAQATSQAVQQGQAMLENRKRFSVTGGGL